MRPSFFCPIQLSGYFWAVKICSFFDSEPSACRFVRLFRPGESEIAFSESSLATVPNAAGKVSSLKPRSSMVESRSLTSRHRCFDRVVLEVVKRPLHVIYQ